MQATTSGPILEPFSGSLLPSAEFHGGGGPSLTLPRELSSVSTVPCDFYTTAFTSLCSDPGSLACHPNSTLRIEGGVIRFLRSAPRTEHVFRQCFENKFKEKEIWANTLVTDSQKSLLKTFKESLCLPQFRQRPQKIHLGTLQKLITETFLLPGRET